MKNIFSASLLSAFTIAILLFTQNVPAQTFTKGVLLVSITEGTAYANYGTTNISGMANDGYAIHIKGVRDPIAIEYGLTNRFGIGLSSGGDIYNINPHDFYGRRVIILEDLATRFYGTMPMIPGGTKSITSEFTVDFDYHYMVTKKIDLSLFAAAGTSCVTIKGNIHGENYNYMANDGIARIGSKARYYFGKRFGMVWMFSAFSTNNNPNTTKSTFGTDYATNVRGIASELGLTFRFF